MRTQVDEKFAYRNAAVPAKRNRESNALSNDSAKCKMFSVNDARFPVTYSRMFRDRLRHVLF